MVLRPPDAQRIEGTLIDKTLSSASVIRLLEEEADDRRPVMDQLRRNAPIPVLVDALQEARQTSTRHLLCDLLGFRAARSAIPALLDVLNDSDRGLRASAVDAIGKAFGYGGNTLPARQVDVALPILVTLWHEEPTPQVRSVLAITLGLIGDKSVEPMLRAALDDPAAQVRFGAQRGLEHLQRRIRSQ